MNFEILPQLIIVLSVAGVLLIIGKNFSKVKEANESELVIMKTSPQSDKEKEKFLYLYKRAIRRINKENYQKTVAKFWLWLEKTLRKIRINFLKLDGRIVALLERLRKKNTASFEKLKETERNIRKNMENENFSKFWNAKKQEIKIKNDLKRSETEIKGVSENIESTSDDKFRKNSESVPGSKYEDNDLVEPAPSNMTYSVQKKAESIPEIDPEEISEKTISVKEKIPEKAPEPIAANPDFEKNEVKEETEEEKTIRTKKEQEYIEILMKNPHDIKAYWKLGLIYSKRRNYDDALACFRQIVKIDPTYTKAKQKAIELMEKMRKKGS